MTNYTNNYFRMMSDILTGYENARKDRESEKDALKKANDWSGIKAWNEREMQFPFPFNRGQLDAFRAWQNSTEYESSHFDVSNLPWAKDAHDFVATLREAGIAEFAITDRSTALMELLHILVEEGCNLSGLCKVTRRITHGVETVTEEYEGVLIVTKP